MSLTFLNVLLAAAVDWQDCLHASANGFWLMPEYQTIFFRRRPAVGTCILRDCRSNGKSENSLLFLWSYGVFAIGTQKKRLPVQKKYKMFQDVTRAVLWVVGEFFKKTGSTATRSAGKCQSNSSPRTWLALPARPCPGSGPRQRRPNVALLPGQLGHGNRLTDCAQPFI
jgi:hypothetical protein